MYDTILTIITIIVAIILILLGGSISITFGRLTRLLSAIGEALKDGVLTTEEIRKVLKEIADLVKRQTLSLELKEKPKKEE